MTKVQGPRDGNNYNQAIKRGEDGQYQVIVNVVVYVTSKGIVYAPYRYRTGWLCNWMPSCYISGIRYQVVQRPSFESSMSMSRNSTAVEIYCASQSHHTS